MPLRIELEDLWRRLATRYKARTEGEEEAGYPVLLETLQPITNFDELKKESGETRASGTSSGTGDLGIWTCPDGKKFALIHARISMGTSVCTFSGVKIRDLSSGLGSFFLKSGLASVSAWENTFGYPIQFEEGDTIWIVIDGHTSPGTVNFHGWGVLEDAF